MLLTEQFLNFGEAILYCVQKSRRLHHVKTVEKIPTKNIHVYYLTLDGHEPSSKSWSEKTLNYQKNIIAYLIKLIVVARGVGGTGDVKLTPRNCWLTNLSIAIVPG